MSIIHNDKSILNNILQGLSSLAKEPYYHKHWDTFYKDLHAIIGEELFYNLEDNLKSIENLKQKETHLSFTAKTLELIQQINMETSSLQPLKKTLNVSVHRLRNISKAHIIFLLLIDKNDSNKYIIKAVAGASLEEYEGYELKIKNSIFEKVMSNKESYIINNLDETSMELDPLTRYLFEKESIKSNIYSPILLNDHCTGFVVLSRRVKYTSTKSHLKMLSTYCNHLAITIENSRLYTKELQISNLHQQVFDAALDEGYSNTIQRLESIIKLPILLIDGYGNTIYKTTSFNNHILSSILELQTEISNRILLIEFDGQQNKTIKIRNDVVITVFPIVLNSKNVAFLIFPKTFEDKGHLDILTIEQFKNVLALKINQENSITEIELRLRRDYLYELLLGLESEEDLYRRGRYLKFNFEESHKILVLRPKNNEQSKINAALEKIRDKIGISSLQFNMIHNDKLVVITPENKVEQLSKKLLAFYESLHSGHTATVGISNNVKSPNDYINGYTEAKRASEFAQTFDISKKVIHFDDLGIVGILLQIDNMEKINVFKEKYLNKLIKYDSEHNTNLIGTLQVYLNNESVIQSSAEQLFVHYNTLRNRIKRIEEVMDLDLNENQAKLNLRVALVIHKLMTK